jgi:hypothetical protein
MKNKLTELIKEAMQYADNRKDIGELHKPYEEYIAEYLIDNNTIVTPCKVGDMTYILGKFTGQVIPTEVTGFYYGKNKVILQLDNGTVTDVDIQLGKTVFLTKEEAEKALKGEGK